MNAQAERTSFSVQDWITPRVRTLPPSGIRAYFDLGAMHPDTISLGLGEPDFTTPERVRDACVQALHEGRTSYTPNAGLPELREAIADYMGSRFGLSYDPAREILVTVGSSEGLDLVLRTLLSPGDEVLVPAPGYVAYAPLIELCGGKVVELDTQAETGFKLTAEALQASLSPRSKVLLVNFPNNPTGATMTAADWQPIAELAVRHNLVVVSDEIYAELTFGHRHFSPAALPGMQERTIVISGFSKAFAMTGWRIGYLCGHPELIAAMLRIHQYTAMCAPILGQLAAVHSLREGLAEMEAMMASYDRRRRKFVEGLRQIGLACHEPQGAFYAFPGIASTGLTSGQFALRLLKEAHVAAVPGSVFGSGGEGFIRCSYAVSEAKLEEALSRMDGFLRKLRSDSPAL